MRLEGFRSDIPVLIEATDVLLVASQDFESFGLTIVEAMAGSTPVVATDVGGIPEVIGENEGGYYLPSDDVKGFAERIVAFLENQELREKVGKTGYERYQKMFTAERMAKKYSALLREAS